ncbi:hypothetical protein CPY51_12415 [Rhizobium tubonense]|uniref:Uncharacterized protein n=1 Tax=Rhizobium tubonense TaxID=484088 RepID=A0A2W4CL65_9HYPH|nr:hypothetical protein CPY51_12415 [Rhizobium tubonense]
MMGAIVVCDADGQEKLSSRFAMLRLYLAQRSALELIALRKGDQLLRDIGLSREEARDSLKPWYRNGTMRRS